MEKPEEMKSNGFKILFFFLFFVIGVNTIHAQTQSSGSTYSDPFNSSSSSSSTSRNNTPSTGTQPSTLGTVTTMDDNPGGDPGGGGMPGGTVDTNVPFDGGLTLLLTIGIAQGFKRSSKQRKKLKLN